LGFLTAWWLGSKSKQLKGAKWKLHHLLRPNLGTHIALFCFCNNYKLTQMKVEITGLPRMG
jgi:hypothetical protein